MWLEIGLFLGVACLVHWIQWRGFLSNQKHPPSFYGLPLFGTVPYLFFRKNLVQLARDTAAEYGPVFRFRLGRTDAIMVNGSELVKEVLKSDDFLGRPPFGAIEYSSKLTKAHPFVSMENERWKSGRNASVQALRELGFGKTPLMEGKIQDEVSVFLDELSAANGSPYDPNSTALASISNNIATLVFGDRLPYDHPKRRCLNDFLQTFLKAASVLNVTTSVPFLTDICAFLKIRVVDDFVTSARATSEILDEEIRTHEMNFTESDKRDFMDHLIAHMRANSGLFSEATSRGSCIAFFAAGSTTTATTVEYLLQCLAAYPQLQARLHQEVTRELGVSRLPVWADHGKLHLVNAFISETMRIFPVVPFGLLRRALRDTKIRGFDVAKGTTIIYNLASANFDPTVFENPKEFNPGRFLNKNGEFVQSPDVLSFAVGKRACPGETFANFQVFLYAAAIIQRFRIEPAEGQNIQLAEADGFFPEAIPQKLRFIHRA
ncbi:cytochrome P450 2C29 [Galendromus occidentalis]|uniref:Cytochrome P450 2C29 n=1 Tax=Galendromus occidentalis TaxID=34638 RepID=A0AAJ6QXF3_9ACAR|nr:cytochrome P450 2C29 [Galendromus occidentalis]